MTEAPSRLRLVLRWLSGMLAGAVLVVAAAGPASAHEGNVGFSEIVVADTEVEYTLWLDVKHLAAEVPLAGAGDVPVIDDPTVPELNVSRDELDRMVTGNVRVHAAGRQLVGELLDVTTTNTSDLSHLGGVALMDPTPLLELVVRYSAPESIDDLSIEYDLFLPDESREPHSNLAWIDVHGDRGFYLFAPDGPAFAPELMEPLDELALPGDDGGSRAPMVIAGLVLIAALGLAGVMSMRSRRPRARK